MSSQCSHVRESHNVVITYKKKLSVSSPLTSLLHHQTSLPSDSRTELVVAGRSERLSSNARRRRPAVERPAEGRPACPPRPPEFRRRRRCIFRGRHRSSPLRARRCPRSRLRSGEPPRRRLIAARRPIHGGICVIGSLQHGRLAAGESAPIDPSSSEFPRLIASRF